MAEATAVGAVAVGAMAAAETVLAKTAMGAAGAMDQAMLGTEAEAEMAQEKTEAAKVEAHREEVAAARRRAQCWTGQRRRSSAHHGQQ